MAAWLSQRSTILSTFSASAINYSTLSGSAITLNSTMISLGTSTNSVYTRLSQGNFNSSVSTSSWVSSLTNRVSTTTVAMSANAQYQLALSQSSISTSVMFTSTLGTSWSTLSGATGLPNYSTISYTAGAVSGTGQYGVLGTSAGQLLVTSTFGQTFSGLNTNLPYVYLSFENSTADQSGENRTVTATGTFTYGTGIVGLNSAFFNNTAGNNTASFYVTVPWPGALNFTITGWFNATSFSSGGFTPTIFATYSNSIRATISNVGVLTVTIPSNGIDTTLATSGTLTTGTWYSYTFIFQTNGLCSFYLNNALVGSSRTNVGGTGTNALTPIYLGSNGSAVNPFIGYMDDINIYTIAMPFRTLTSSVTPVPAIYLPLNTVPTDGSQSSGTAPATLTVVGPPTVAPSSYILGTGAIRVANTLGNVAATQYIRGSWSGATNFTVSFWFNTQLSTASVLQQVIFSAYGTSISITINTSNQLVVAYPSGTGAGQTTLNTSFTVALNIWYNITFIFQTGNICYLYVSNLPIISFVNAGIGSFTSSAFGIGTFDVGPVVYGFNGYIDDFKIYNSAVPIANLLPATVSTPLIYFPMDTVPTNATISLGAAPVSPVVIGTPTQAPSYIMGTGAINLTNTIGGSATQSIRIPWTIGTSFTWTFWFNAAGSGGQQDIITATFGGVSVVLTSDNYLFAYSNKNLAQTTFKIVPNTWYSVVFIYQLNSTGYFYVNNQLIGTFICPSYGNSSETVTIGSNNTNLGDSAFSGYIDDFKIYNTAIPFTPMYPPHSFTSTTVSNSGQYMLATMANQGLYMSSNFGGTFSPVTGVLLNALWSNAQISATGQYMLVNAAPVIVQPQLTGLPSSGTTALITNPWQVNGITWIARASSIQVQAGLLLSNLFNNVPTETWASTGTYTSIAEGGGIGDYTGSVSTPIVGTSDYPGEWIQIQSSVPVVMYSYSIAGGGSAGWQVPRTYTILGSNDGSIWYQLQTATIASGSPYGSNAYVTTSSIIMNTSGTITVTGSNSATSTYTIGTTAYTTNAYTYFRLCVNKSIRGAFGQLEIGEWYINFQAGGQTYSTNYGSTWSNQPALYSQQTLMTVYGPTVSPQRTGLTGDTTTATVVQTTWVQNGISWTSNASNTILAAGYQPWVAFNNVGNITSVPYSWASLPIYPTPTSITNISSPGPGNYTGEWLQIYSSVPLVMYSYNFACGGSRFNFPKEYFIVGSRDTSTWFPIQLVVLGATNPFTTDHTIATSSAIIVNSSASQTINGGAAVSFTPTIYSTTSNPYNYFRIIAKTNFGGSNFELNEWYVNFTPQSTTAASMTYPSTTLALSESGQYALSATVSNPVLLGELNFELSSPNQYDDSIVGGLTNPTAQGTGITISSTAKVGTKSLSIVNTAGQSGSNSYVSYTLPSFFAGFPNAFTISAWIRPSSLPLANTGAVPIHMGFVGSGGGKTLLQMVIYPSGIFSFEFFTTTNLSTQLQIITVSAITLNVWTHVTGVIANGIAYVYINGVLQNSASYTGVPCIQTIGLAATTLVVGCVAGNYNQYAGLIDNVRIYNSALTPQQIQTIYANNVSSPDLIQISPSFSVSPQQTGLASNSWTQNGVSWTASASATYNGSTLAYNAFSGAYAIAWAGAPNAYRNGSPFDYTAGTYSTNIQGVGSTGGDWLQVQSSVPLIMASYTFASSGVLQQPQKYYIVGSNDGQTWFPIQLANGTVNPLTTANTACSSYLLVSTSTTPTAQTIQGNTTGSYTITGYAGSLNTYTYFRIVVTNTWGYANGNTNIGQWFINFTGPANTSLYNIVSPLSGFSTNTYSSGTIPGVITNSAISNTGQYMVVITNNTSGNNVYYSINYGATFTGLQLGTVTLTSCAMSYDGSYITIASGATVYTLNNNSTGFSVALGNQAGYQNQANNAIAIGNYAGYQNQTANSIILNASGPGALGTGLNAVVQGFYVAPIASCVASSSQSFSILGYGSDNQVVQTGLTVLPDTGTFNLNAPVGSTTSGILSSRYYLWGVGDNQDANGIDNNVYGPWYGVGLSGIPGFTNVPCLCGFYGVSMRSGNGYIILTEAGNVGIGTTNPSSLLDVAGLSRLGGNTGIRVFTFSGTFPASAIQSTIALPSGATSSNIISIQGFTSGSGVDIFPWDFRGDSNWTVSYYLSSVYMVVTNTGPSTFSKAYRGCIITSS